MDQAVRWKLPSRHARISEWVEEARQFIEEGRPGGISESPFEFCLTDLLDQFWTLVDRTLLPSGSENIIFGDPMSSVFQYPFKQEHVIDAMCARIPAWRFEDHEGIWDFAMIHLCEEPVALLGMHEEGLYGGPMGWRWDSPGGPPEPSLHPLPTRSCIPLELLDTTAGLPILIDLVRRSITEFHGKHGYCSNCCSRVFVDDLHDGECAQCATVVH